MFSPRVQALLDRLDNNLEWGFDEDIMLSQNLGALNAKITAVLVILLLNSFAHAQDFVVFGDPLSDTVLRPIGEGAAAWIQSVFLTD